MRAQLFKLSARWAVMAALLALTACAGIPERKPLPPEYTLQAQIPGIPNARFWGNEWPVFSSERLKNFTDADFQREYSGVYNTPHNYLAISGGGANGAFGAGLLLGWTARGDRPEFSMVTGVSTGALSAPFAFLGPEYDKYLKQVYTETTTLDIAEKLNPYEIVTGDSMTDTAPLKRLIARYITEELVAKIAIEHQRGRRLYIGTVNLDAGRSVIWNIGAIASSDYPEKLQLIRELLRASAAIPVAFPPVVISVEVYGEMYDELHVDGGTGSQVFVYPAAVDWREITRRLKVQGEPKVYVIRNSFLDPDYQGIKRSVLPIASRTIDSLIRSQGMGDLYQIYALSKRDGNEFNLAYIPSTFEEEPTEGFDPVYMNKLFDLGFQMAVDGYPWEKAPPGYIINSSK